MTAEWNAFRSTPAGTVIFNHSYAECVAVANLMNETVLGLPFVPVDSAYEWWSLRHVIATLANNYTPSATPVAGAIVVWAGPGWNAQHGHIGTVLEVNGDGTFVTLEQNAGSKARYTYRHLRSVRDGGLQGFLIPNNNPAAASAPLTPTPVEEEDIMAVYLRATGNSSPLDAKNPGSSRIWAGDNREISGSVYSGVWERSEDGSVRRLFPGELKAIQDAYAAAGRKFPIADISGNELEKMYLIERAAPKPVKK